METLRRFLKILFVRLAIYQPYVKLRQSFRFAEYEFRGTNQQTYTIEEVSVSFNTDDPYSRAWFFPRYANGAIHEKTASRLLVYALRRSRVFIDVGANLGWFSCLAGKCMPDGEIYSFEMDDQNLALLKANISLNRCDNIEPFHMAVTSSDGFTNYQRAARLPSTNFAIEVNETQTPRFEIVKVRTTSLDSFCINRQILPDLVKIDVEGAEMMVLRGMKSLLTHDHLKLLLEIHPTYLPRFGSHAVEIISYLQRFDFKIYQIEDSRGQSDRLQLLQLTHGNELMENCMVYATKHNLLESDFHAS
ncbi:MAG: FkbM family methyltransferase [Anaerolineales bacterium]|nr:FkbM family methyltransferase [Anaerolineales bacterium]